MEGELRGNLGVVDAFTPLMRQLRRCLQPGWALTYERLAYFHFPATNVLPEAPALDPEFTLLYPCPPELLTPEHFALFTPTEHEHPVMRRQLERGDQVGVIMKAGQIVHRTMVAKREFDGHHLVRGVPLRPGDVYIHSCATVAPFRGRGFYPIMLRSVVHHAHQHPDFSRAMICCAASNAASLAGIKRAGFQPLCAGYHLRLFGGRMGVSYFGF
ncbi:MAG: GNAT family N-acetyltransferase [Armatimonadota bacterium]